MVIDATTGKPVLSNKSGGQAQRVTATCRLHFAVGSNQLKNSNCKAKSKKEKRRTHAISSRYLVS